MGSVKLRDKQAVEGALTQALSLRHSFDMVQGMQMLRGVVICIQNVTRSHANTHTYTHAHGRKDDDEETEDEGGGGGGFMDSDDEGGQKTSNACKKYLHWNGTGMQYRGTYMHRDGTGMQCKGYFHALEWD
eukprot:1161755-Pelagomonas_calceolata.AAC.17